MNYETRKRLAAEIVELCRRIGFVDDEQLHDLLDKFVGVDVPRIEIRIMIEGSHVPSAKALRAFAHLLPKLMLEEFFEDERGQRLSAAFPETPDERDARGDALGLEALRQLRSQDVSSNSAYAVQQLQQAARYDGALLNEAASRPWLTSGWEVFSAHAVAELHLTEPPAAGTSERVKRLLWDAAGPLTSQRAVTRSRPGP
jgi:hypothetical protein